MTGPVEIAIVAGVAFLIFGAKKLPEFARSLGKAKNEFRRGMDEGEAEADGVEDEVVVEEEEART